MRLSRCYSPAWTDKIFRLLSTLIKINVPVSPFSALVPEDSDTEEKDEEQERSADTAPQDMDTAPPPAIQVPVLVSASLDGITVVNFFSVQV